ncbi:FKBP-type peptidyl-prolyl cis-trans isomerase, partial [Delftia tsuruhatensis]
MNITKDTAVTINYKITDKLGKLLDKGDVAYLHGGYDNIFAKVEAALDGKAVGDTLTVDLAVEDAFGARDESLTRTIPKGEFPPGVKVGGQLR